MVRSLVYMVSSSSRFYLLYYFSSPTILGDLLQLLLGCHESSMSIFVMQSKYFLLVDKTYMFFFLAIYIIRIAKIATTKRSLTKSFINLI